MRVSIPIIWQDGLNDMVALNFSVGMLPENTEENNT